MTPADKNKWALIVAGTFLILLAAGGVYWFFENYERAERQVRSDASPAAQRNPYLAAERYLSRLGYQADTVRGRERLKTPPLKSGALVVHDAGPSLPPDDEDRLLEWVDRGGHLVLVSRRVWSEDTRTSYNHLFDRFGVRLRHQDHDHEEEGVQFDSPVVAPRKPVTVRRTDPAKGDVRRYTVAFDPQRYLEDTTGIADERIAGDHGSHMLGWTHGQGRLTILSDAGFMLNDYIGEYDHAWLVTELLKDQDKVWFVVDAAMPPLTRLLWRHLPEAAASFILLALLCLWRAATTHGPRRRSRSQERRNIVEHLDAVAAYAWSYDRPGMVNRSRTLVEDHWLRRHPRLNQMDEQSRCAWIAEQAGLPVEQVRVALYTPVADEQSMIRTTAVQQRLIGLLSNPATNVKEQT